MMMEYILHVKINTELGLYIKIQLFYMARVNVDAIRVSRDAFFPDPFMFIREHVLAGNLRVSK